jgi:ankyrin repeat protein
VFLASVRSGDVAAVAEQLRLNPRLAAEPAPPRVGGGRPTALHVAVENDRLEIANLLFRHGADANAPSDAYDGWTPLLLAASGGKRAFVELLLAHGARVNAWEAAALGDASRLGALIAENPAVVRERGVNDAPPVHFASTVDGARLLVDAALRSTPSTSTGRPRLARRPTRARLARRLRGF